MQREGISPDAQVFMPILAGCAQVVALDKGRLVHQLIQNWCVHMDTNLGNALINMYGKCGVLAEAEAIFADMKLRHVPRDTITWSTMVQIYGVHKEGRKALETFHQMKVEGAEPNEISLIAVLQACSHSKLVAMALQILATMQQKYNVLPTIKHLNCVVDALSRAGHLNEALQLALSGHSDIVTWKTLLGACWWYKDKIKADIVASKLLALNPGDPSLYVLMGNLCAALQLWEESQSWTQRMKSQGIAKQVGISWIEIQGEIHSFKILDKEHPMQEKIYKEWKVLKQELLENGHCFDLAFVLHQEEKIAKEDILCTHSEKLALAFGLISTPAHTPQIGRAHV